MSKLVVLFGAVAAGDRRRQLAHDARRRARHARRGVLRRSWPSPAGWSRTQFALAPQCGRLRRLLVRHRYGDRPRLEPRDQHRQVDLRRPDRRLHDPRAHDQPGLPRGHDAGHPAAQRFARPSTTSSSLPTSSGGSHGHEHQQQHLRNGLAVTMCVTVSAAATLASSRDPQAAAEFDRQKNEMAAGLIQAGDERSREESRSRRGEGAGGHGRHADRRRGPGAQEAAQERKDSLLRYRVTAAAQTDSGEVTILPVFKGLVVAATSRSKRTRTPSAASPSTSTARRSGGEVENLQTGQWVGKSIRRKDGIGVIVKQGKVDAGVAREKKHGRWLGRRDHHQQRRDQVRRARPAVVRGLPTRTGGRNDDFDSRSRQRKRRSSATMRSGSCSIRSGTTT